MERSIILTKYHFKMKKVFKCQEKENDILSVDHDKTTKRIVIDVSDKETNDSIWICLSKPDVIEFCRELLKQIAMLE